MRIYDVTFVYDSPEWSHAGNIDIYSSNFATWRHNASLLVTRTHTHTHTHTHIYIYIPTKKQLLNTLFNGTNYTNSYNVYHYLEIGGRSFRINIRVYISVRIYLYYCNIEIRKFWAVHGGRGGRCVLWNFIRTARWINCPWFIKIRNLTANSASETATTRLYGSDEKND